MAAIKAISVTAATWLIRDVLNLRDRHPVLWSCVLRGQVPPLRAFQLTQVAARKYPTAPKNSYDCATCTKSFRAAADQPADSTSTTPSPTPTASTTKPGPTNLGPLTRTLHRAKTTRRWQLKQPASGIFWWTSPHHQHYRVTNHGTDDLHQWSTGEQALLWRRDAQPPPNG